MNLQDLIPLTRPLIFFDTETTGPEPKDDRIVSLGFIWFRPEHEPVRWHKYVNPGIPIPREATYGNGGEYPGHGVTDDMVKDAPSFGDLAPGLLKGFVNCDYGGKNIRGFDLPLMRAEFERHGHTWSYDDARIIDIHRMWQFIDPRTLSDAVRRFLHEEMEGAHDAMHDIEATLRVAAAQFLECERLPRDLQALHDLLFPRKENAIDPDNKIVWKDGAATMNFGKKWRGMRLDLMSRKDLTWIAFTATGVNPTVKQICKAALDGKFPIKESAHGSNDPGVDSGGGVPLVVGGGVVPQAQGDGRLFT